jgi:transposase
MQDHVSRLVGLEGFEVKRVIEEGDQLHLEVELVAGAGCCPHCGRASLDVKERPVVRVRDLPIFGRVIYLRWRKRRYRCAGCERSFTEQHPELPARQQVTRRFRRHLLERTRSGAAHAEVARAEQTTRYQVGRAFEQGYDELSAVREELPPRRISLDELAHRRGSRGLVTAVSDPDRRRLLDLVDGRDRRTIARYLRSLPEQRRLAIEVVAIDPYEAYRQALQAELPGTRIVVDPFTSLRGAGQALDTVRGERQRERSGAMSARRSQRGSFREHIFRQRHRLLRASERLTERERRRLCELFEQPLSAEAWD